MNTEQLHDALTALPEDVIASTAQARTRKRVILGPWVSLAACACLVFVVGSAVLPFFSLKSAAPEHAGSNIMMDAAEDCVFSEKSESGHLEACVLLVEVTQVHKGSILVQPLDGQDIAADSLIAVAVNPQESYVTGDRLRILHNGQILETWPLQLGVVYSIERITS